MEQFLFIGFNPSEELQYRTDFILERLVEIAPSDAKITASLDFDGEHYHCLVELGSRSTPFSLSVTDSSPEAALDRAEKCLIRKLDKWRSTRFTPQKKPTKAAAYFSRN